MSDPNDLHECHPLNTLDALLNWQKPNAANWAKYTKPLKARSQFCYLASTDCQNVPSQKFHKEDTPKTLFCHDMKGGYLEDRFVDGSDKSDSYVFSHWSVIDVFVYFSHSLVTIPPLSWINSAHRHGVPVLGTFITEWESGEAIWKEVLSDESKEERLIGALTGICDYYGFDGYLLNIENDLSGGREEAAKVVEFVRRLKASLLDARGVDSASLIWYDAVTVNGELKHQNKLNSLNKTFFDACDGIFLNYCWKEKDLGESVACVSEGGGRDRRGDVYVGVDVWGRGCLGGGGFNVNEAMVLVRQLSLSVALFACGWTHEKSSETDSFEAREALFWTIASRHLFLHGPSTLPFETDFCRGFGQKRFEHGIEISDKAWYNLSEQSFQLSDSPGTFAEGAEGSSPPPCVSYFKGDSYRGGGCIRLVPSDHKHRLFVCEFELRDRLRVRTLTKLLKDNSSSHLAIVLNLDESSGSSREVVLEEQDINSDVNGVVDTIPARPFRLTEHNSWVYREFNVDIRKPSILNQISCILRGSEPILLGELAIEEAFK